MPVCDSVNDVNTPTAYSGISALVTPPNATISRPAATGEQEDAVREHEPVAPVRELAGQVAVAGDDRRQPREVGVRGVGGEHEDRRGRELQDPEDGAVAEHRAGPSARSPSASWLGYGCEVVGEHRDAEEQRAEDDAPSTRASWPRSSTPAAGTRARRWRSPRRRSARPRPTRSPSGGGRGRACRRPRATPSNASGSNGIGSMSPNSRSTTRQPVARSAPRA